MTKGHKAAHHAAHKAKATGKAPPAHHATHKAKAHKGSKQKRQANGQFG